MTKTLYARVDEAAYDYVHDMAKRSGLPLAKVVSAILTEAMLRGWDMNPYPSLITERAADGQLPA